MQEILGKVSYCPASQGVQPASRGNSHVLKDNEDSGPRTASISANHCVVFLKLLSSNYESHYSTHKFKEFYKTKNNHSQESLSQCLINSS